MRVTRHLAITGLVQGVWYRESLREAADGLGVAGWVRNRLDGSVEAMIQGEERPVEQLIEWCRQGPPLARVLDVTVSLGEGEFVGFEKRPTG
ncbi:MAG TPA: acylphosphatase [Thiobacillaceae bacterium]|nr:acylphosphatase [Thiobacillaceae bacterium]HNA82278.1 acylphosphatase [Thiobacillaceae bacterium]HNF88409.1 acylphosphatase [Thiobacillaceae bacterium]HNI06941.1 acylphosphatase [Thiobacillaceae bacterium]